MRRTASLAVLLIVPAIASLSAQAPDPWAPLSRSRVYKDHPTGPDISAADLAARLYRFADDSMAGRFLGTAGNYKGVEYIASEVRRFGLEPAGENGGYFQTVPVIVRTVDTTATLSAGGTTLTPMVDFIPRDMGAGARHIDGAQVIYGGTWGDSASLISPDAAKGKFVVLAVSPAAYPAGNPPGTANRFAVSAYFHDAAGVAIAGMDLIPREIQGFYRRGGPSVGNGNAVETPSYLYITKRGAEVLLGAPLDSARAGMAGRTLQGNPGLIEQKFGEFPARNVVAILRGSDPVLRNEFVAIGAHNDHIGTRRVAVAHDSMYVIDHLFRLQGADDPDPELTAEQFKAVDSILAAVRKRTHGASARPDSVFNGADDDGSGSVSVLEIAQYFAARKHRPRRSLIFVWHVGEELGLFGSAWFTDHPTVPRDSIVAQLNIDMIGRGGNADIAGKTKEGALIHGNPDYVQVIGSRRLSTELGDLATATDKANKHPLAFDYALDANGHPTNIYCRSDHYEYARYGIPIIFFTTGGHADYHQVTDEPQYIDYQRMARIANYVAELATKVADLDHRPVVDHQKPDPNGACQQ
jgi:hypothetical protein